MTSHTANHRLNLDAVSVVEAKTDIEWRKNAAFNLHEATEAAYACFLLVRTLYFPRSHNIKFLRSTSEDNEPRLIEAWPRATREERRRFELLKRAYVEARYSVSYEISDEDLAALTQSVRSLRDLVATVFARADRRTPRGGRILREIASVGSGEASYLLS